jgi:hypothetical protein
VMDLKYSWWSCWATIMAGMVVSTVAISINIESGNAVSHSESGLWG